MTSVADRALAAGEGGAADERDGAAGGLAEGELGGGRQLVGDGADGRAHDPAVGVGDAAQVLERQQPGHADGDVDDAPAPRPAERIGHDDRHVDAEAGSHRGADAGRRGVGIARQERDERPRIGPDVRRVDAAVGADEPVRRLGDEHAVLHAHDAAGLAEDDLDLARVAVEALGELERLLAGDDAGQVDDGALGLGHDLLGHDQHVTLGSAAGRPASARSRRR